MMKAALVMALIIGIIIGFVIGYDYQSLSTQKSWRQLTSFIAATPNSTLLEGFEQAYSYPNVYYDKPPNFTIEANFWRVKLETMPYYNYSGAIVYYSDAPLNNIRIWKDKAYFGFPFSYITMLDPDDFNVTSSDYTEVQGFGFYYALRGSWKYKPVKTIYTFDEAGTYMITLELMEIGCFNFTIEEYR